MKKNEKNFHDTLKNYFKGLGMTQNDIAETLGISVVMVNTLLNGKRNFGKQSALKWSEAFGFNPLWLITGEGSMLKDTYTEAVSTLPNVYYAPLVSKYAYAGVTNGWGDDEYIETLPKFPAIVDHEPHGEYYAFEVRGDSMEDGSDRSIKDGSIALCRLITPDLYHDARLHLNKWVFVVVTSDGILIKRIIDHNISDNTITLSSYNPAYHDQVVSLEDVKAVLNVVKVTATPTI